MAKNEVQKAADNAVPAHLQGGKTATVGNIDRSDLVIPRVKLLQAISPEVSEEVEGAKSGIFWHTIAAQGIQPGMRGIPIILRKSYVLWSPRNDDRGILARSNDALHWDQPAGTNFEVKPKNAPHSVKYVLGETVHDSADGGPSLIEFGSSIPGNPNSPPAAALTYQFLWYFPELPDLSPAIIINTRSSVKPAQTLLSKIDLRPVDHFGQAYKIGVVKQQGDEGPFYNYTYTADGYASEEEYETAKMMYEKFRDEDWVANEEEGDTDINDVGGRSKGGAPVSEEEIDKSGF